jgi:hypothetical protein
VDLAEVVLQQRRQAATVRLVREHHVEPELVGAAEREPGSVRVPVDVVDLDRVVALALADVEAPLHDRSQHRAPTMSSQRSPGHPFERRSAGPGNRSASGRQRSHEPALK